MRYELRVIDVDGITRTPHPGPKDAARAEAQELARRLYPHAEGYRHRWNADCRMVFRDGKHVADVSVEPLEVNDE